MELTICLMFAGFSTALFQHPWLSWPCAIAGMAFASLSMTTAMETPYTRNTLFIVRILASMIAFYVSLGVIMTHIMLILSGK